MSESTNIEWCDSTFNPWIGCTKVSPACDHCYAEVSTAARSLGVTWGPRNDRHRTSLKNWDQPLKWERDHEAFFAVHGRRRRVFCASLADVFDIEVPAAWRMDLFSLISQTPNLDWLILTKRIGNVMPMCSGDGLMFDMICQRVWLGATIVNQEEADRDIPKLLTVPAAVRFLSMEPLLGPVHIMGWLDVEASCPCGEMSCDHEAIDWVIVGGESGHKARPMHPDWVRSLRDQCAAAGVPFLFKQWGEWAPGLVRPGGDLGGDMRRGTAQIVHAPGNPEGCFRRGDALMRITGKKAAGRTLDRVTHTDFPKAPA
jgi:protein gp37